MRIEKVVIENLNSLAGRFEIDLDDKAYSGGLFAIIGPSGAGKTTVLDAMCLALYGKTPRIDTISETQDELMNKYENTCAAEVVFTSRGKRYKSTFSHERTSRGGKPFRAVKREVLEQAADGIWNVAAASIRESALKIEELTGLNYDRFSRSIMLAQFRFAEFLQAGSNDRAAILEQMTDMDIYRRISVAVYERARAQRTALQDIRTRMAEVTADVLDDERLALLEAERGQLDRAIPAHGALKDRICECRDILARIQKRVAELDSYRQDEAVRAAAMTAEKEKFAAAEKEEREQKVKQTALAQTLKAVRALDIRLAAQSAETKRLESDIAADDERVKVYKTTILDVFKKFFPNAAPDVYKDMYFAENIGDKLLSKAKTALDDVQQEEQGILKIVSETLLQKDEAFWRGQLDALKIAVPLAEAREEAAAAQQKLDAQQKNQKELLEREQTLEAQAKEAEDRFVYASLEKRFGQERQNLKPGQPCPLCGATEHPGAQREHDVLFYKDAEEQRESAQKALKTLRQDLAHSTKTIMDLETLIREKSLFAGQQQVRLPEGSAELALIPAQTLQQSVEDAERVLKEYSALLAQRSAVQQKITVLTARLGDVDKDVQLIGTNRRMIGDIEAQKESKKVLLGQTQQLFAQIRDERTQLFGEKNADDEEAAAEKMMQQTILRKETCRTAADAAVHAAEQNRRDIVRTQEDTAKESHTLESAYASVLAQAALVEIVSQDSELKPRYETWEMTAAQLHEQPDDTALGAAADALAALISGETAHKGALGQVIKNNEQNRQKLKDLKRDEATQKKAAEKWDKLNALIGSADGVKFSRMAQSITFDSLLRYANACLCRMNDRYILVRDAANASKPLELAVADTYQAGETRPVANLSGGESFIVSLALALGLSEMSSGRARIDSLFIDEGFASLDEAYMEAALQTLSTLGSREGKLVGVISHVDALKERIDVQIEVKRLSGGRSTLEGPGVKAEAR